MDWSVQEVIPAQLAHYLSLPKPDDHKYMRGVLGVISGSANFPGAAILNIEGAIRSGAGMVRYLGDSVLIEEIVANRPEAVFESGEVDAYLIGSGLSLSGSSKELKSKIDDAMASEVPVILDADAMQLAQKSRHLQILTPHSGELSKWLTEKNQSVSTSDINQNPCHYLQLAASLIESNILLKGNTTFIASYTTKQIIKIEKLPTVLATAGSGDVLAGIIAGLTVQCQPEKEAELVQIAALAVLLHAQAAYKASNGGPIAALDIALSLPKVIRSWLKGDFFQEPFSK